MWGGVEGAGRPSRAASRTPSRTPKRDVSELIHSSSLQKRPYVP
jgi:hypothetical protein